MMGDARLIPSWLPVRCAMGGRGGSALTSYGLLLKDWDRRER